MSVVPLMFSQDIRNKRACFGHTMDNLGAGSRMSFNFRGSINAVVCISVLAYTLCIYNLHHPSDVTGWLTVSCILHYGIRPSLRDLHIGYMEPIKTWHSNFID